MYSHVKRKKKIKEKDTRQKGSQTDWTKEERNTNEGIRKEIMEDWKLHTLVSRYISFPWYTYAILATLIKLIMDNRKINESSLSGVQIVKKTSSCFGFF